MENKKEIQDKEKNDLAEKAAGFLADLFVSAIDDKNINKKRDESD